MGDSDDRLARVEARLAALEQENAELRTRLDRPATVPASGPDCPTTTSPLPVEAAPVGRRSVLTRGLAAAGAATAGAMALAAQPAAAANGQPLVLGVETNTASNPTQVNATGPLGFGTLGSPQIGIYGYTTNADGIGLGAAGNRAQLAFLPRTSNVQPPYDAGTHQAGEVVVDIYGNLWYCNTTGTPGQWRSVSGPGNAGGFFPWTAPIRAYDSRPGTNPANPGPKTKLVAGQTRLINLRTAGATNANSRGALVQVLLVNAAAGNGNFTIWSGSAAKPLANTLVWGGSSGRFSTLAYTNVADTGTIQVNASLGTDLVLDVIGIYG